MNLCEYSDQVLDYRLGRLTVEQKREFEAHLESCEICQQEMAIETAIEKELAIELQPGLIEGKTIARLRLLETRDMRSFWLYAYRMIVVGITVTIAVFVLLPFLSTFPFKSFLDLGKYGSGLSEVLGGVVAVNPIFLVIGFCYLLLIASSICSLGYTRR
jgi:hypothetical protein